MTIQDDWLSHRELKIVRGVGKTPADNFSAETNLIVVNLLSGKVTLQEWSPNIPAVKSGGVWADSPINDGRQLLAAPVGNVTEQMSILIADSTYLGVQAQLASLNKMVEDCRDYWQSDYQIDPVYLMWYASCGAGPQYALISNIELAPEYLASPIPSLRVSVTIEREPAWRWIPPGANPKIWAYEVNASKPQFNINTASLVPTVATDSTNLISQIVWNRFEWTAALYGLQSTPLTQPYVTIPAASVPGDAPALCAISLYNALRIEQVFIAVTSKKFSGIDHTGITRSGSLWLAAGDGNNTGIVTKTAAAVGIISNGSNVQAYYGQRTATGIDANYVTACQWGGNAPASGLQLDRQFFRGTFAVFVRANNNSAAPTLADMKMRVLVEEFEDATNQYISSITLPEVQVPITVVTAGMGLSYMGTVSLPLANRAVVSPLGYGIQLQETTSNLRISLQLKYDVATANRIFLVMDMIFIPIDEGMAQVVTQAVAAIDNTIAIIDNTGYLGRGKSEQVAVTWITRAISGGISQEVRGQDITLKPGVDQRIYFLTARLLSAGGEAHTGMQLTANINIIPRSYGIRSS